MIRITRNVLIGLLLVSMILPFVPQSGSTSLLTGKDMVTLVGGEKALDCAGLATYIQGWCLLIGINWITCAIVIAGAYLVCLAANAIA